MFKGGTVYILSSVSKRVLYVGVTSDLERRIIEHKTKAFPNSFTARFNCCQLMYYKHFAINPKWDDLSLTLTDWWPE